MNSSFDERLYQVLAQRLEERGVDVRAVEAHAMSLCVETPSWGYADSGTRFKVFRQPGAARTIFEKLQDAAEVHRLTGIAPRVAIHIPWDKVDDYAGLGAYAKSLGVAIGAVNPNLFEDDDYKFGSVTNVSPAIRRKAVAHMEECIAIAKVVGSELFTPWFADGTNYPGQGDFRQRKHWLEECLREVYGAMPESMTMAIEYKFFEPAFYHTDLADWGMVYALVTKLGPRAKVLVDLGHHPLGTNIEHIVAVLLDEGRLGGFHFNSKKYADDDMTVGSHAPYELFLIFNELVKAELDRERPQTVAYMIDQSHAIKPKVEAMIQSVVHVQQVYCKALLVDREALAAAQLKNDVIAAEMILREAFETDVRPLLAHARLERGLPADPLQAYRDSGYLERVIRERSSR
jgi:L-rhamnose isomerase/sugar isomerase